MREYMQRAPTSAETLLLLPEIQYILRILVYSQNIFPVQPLLCGTVECKHACATCSVGFVVPAFLFTLSGRTVPIAVRQYQFLPMWKALFRELMHSIMYRN